MNVLSATQNPSAPYFGVPAADPVLDIQAKILFWRENPDQFVREVFGAEPDNWQDQALKDMTAYNWLSIKSGHGVGKSTFLSWAILWFMTCFYPCKVPCTAPSAHQLYDILWAEIRLWHRKMPPALSSQFEIKSDRIDLVGGGDSFAVARTSRKENPDALQGFHSENILFVVDEASGVEEIVFEVAKGALSTRGARQLLTGNPTKSSGYFFKSFQNPLFHHITVSCLESKNVDPDYISSMAAEYGIESNVYRYRVLGEFPKSDEDVLIPLDLVQDATGRDIFTSGKPRPVWGLDVARYGNDRSCLVKRHPRELKHDIKVWNQLSTMELVGHVKAEWDATEEEERPEAIYVDVIGVGAGVVDRLSELGLPVVGINVSESPAIGLENVFRMRDELWMGALRWFESRSVRLKPGIKNLEYLVNELTGIRKGYTSSGKLRVESKDDMKKRGLRSPDVADGFVLTFAFQSSVASGHASARNSNWKTKVSRSNGGTVA